MPTAAPVRASVPVTPVAPPTSRSDQSDLAAARAIVKALDTWQLDPIIGFFAPGLGDMITAVAGAFLVVVAGRRRVPPIVIARMLLNLGVDLGVGAIPLVGDVADFGIRANKKNLALLEQRTATGGKGTWKDWAAVAGAGVLCIATLSLVVYIFVRFLTWVF